MEKMFTLLNNPDFCRLLAFLIAVAIILSGIIEPSVVVTIISCIWR